MLRTVKSIASRAPSRIDILDGKPLKRGRGRVDCLLCAYNDLKAVNPRERK